MVKQVAKKEEGTKQLIDMRLRILNVASSLMIEKGVKETSLKDIAKEAGMSKGTLYYYYSAKEDIIYDIADQNLKQITEGLLAWIDDANTDVPPVQILKEVFEKILGAETRGKLHLYLLSDADTTNSAITERFRERYADWRKTLEYGLNKVLPKKKENNEVLSFLILAVLDGLIIQKMFGTDNIPVEKIIKLIMSTK
nr:TetR/AcrR family transcriptional regulator [Sedimentibacter sp.]